MTRTWMSEKQREDYDAVCLIIEKVKTPKQFYAACREINSGKYDFDTVNCVREDKRFFNSAQFLN